MKQKHWTLLFAIVLLGELLGIQLQNSILQFIFKPLIIPVVIGYFDSQVNDITKGFNKWIVFALIFSWIGDVLLMFQDKKDIFFLLGLSSFLLAHIFYIIYFHKARLRDNVKSNPWLLVIVVVYYAALISFLSPYLGDMKLPVRIYGIVISFMFMLALHMFFIKNKSAGKWMMIGALLFVLSDSLLAIDRFYQTFEFAGILIILTYALAQFFIVKGAVDYFNSVDKE
ncbi:MAG: lysoplasmalogenase [Chitinophagaceae bacterium]|nr:lysoplasmalogenase [Chitinophagaceae bacterium]MBP6476938.1 lysoplasmalogenase [Chitinophagaceae bacterium]MBP7107962.1 lysoplasmalogenase [Chitinophagaceae bacterium]MBP7314020.1 lysoplasmalogenase [Chitinophagaceae bacterium]HQV56298.1 lysoplasmalogenase [Chitinophagaceae bacterium]